MEMLNHVKDDTARKNLDSHYPKKDRNLVKWGSPFLWNDFSLSLIIQSSHNNIFFTIIEHYKILTWKKLHI